MISVSQGMANPSDWTCPAKCFTSFTLPRCKIGRPLMLASVPWAVRPRRQHPAIPSQSTAKNLPHNFPSRPACVQPAKEKPPLPRHWLSRSRPAAAPAVECRKSPPSPAEQSCSLRPARSRKPKRTHRRRFRLPRKQQRDGSRDEQINQHHHVFFGEAVGEPAHQQAPRNTKRQDQ